MMNANTKLALTLIQAQVDLACLDTMHGDYSEYGQCLRFAMGGSGVDAITLMFKAVGAVTFDTCDYETASERRARWDAANWRSDAEVIALPVETFRGKAIAV